MKFFIFHLIFSAGFCMPFTPEVREATYSTSLALCVCQNHQRFGETEGKLKKGPQKRLILWSRNMKSVWMCKVESSLNLNNYYILLYPQK